MKKVIFFSLFLIAFTMNTQARQDWRHWHWTSLNLYKNENWKFGLFFDNRFKDGMLEDNYFNFTSAQFTYFAHENLDLGFNLSFYKIDTANGFDDALRYEFEVNPKMKLDNGIALHNRNRVEFRDIQGKGDWNTRSRHRFQVTIPIKTPVSCFKGISINNEFFMNWDNNVNRYNENRFQPIALKFKFNKHLAMNLFYMIQSKRKRDNDNWTDTNALGTHLVINF